MKKTTILTMFLFLFSIPPMANAQWWKFWEKKKPKPPCTYMHRGYPSWTGVVCAEFTKNLYSPYHHKSTLQIPSPSWTAVVNDERDSVYYDIQIFYKPQTIFDRNYNLLVVIRYDSNELEHIRNQFRYTESIVDQKHHLDPSGPTGKGTLLFLIDPERSKHEYIALTISFLQKDDNDDITYRNVEKKLAEYEITPTFYKHKCDVWGTIKVFPKNIPLEWYNPTQGLVDQFMKNLIKEMFDSGFGKVFGYADVFKEMQEVELPALYVIGPKSKTITKEKALAAPKPVRQVEPQKAITLEPEKPESEPEPPPTLTRKTFGSKTPQGTIKTLFNAVEDGDIEKMMGLMVYSDNVDWSEVRSTYKTENIKISNLVIRELEDMGNEKTMEVVCKVEWEDKNKKKEPETETMRYKFFMKKIEGRWLILRYTIL